MIRIALTAALAAPLAFATATSAAPRDIQIVAVDLVNGVVTLQNVGDGTEPLGSYRFCTANSSVQLQYTSNGGFGSLELEPGEQLFVHWNDDAPGTPDSIDVSSLGGNIAGPIDNGPFGLAIYWATPFGNPNNVADYVQWTDDLSNPGNLTADARADEASDGGVWTGQNEWIVTTSDAIGLNLLDLSGAELHGPADYEVEEEAGNPCPADFDGMGEVGFSDLLVVLSSWGPCTGCPADLDMSGDVGFSDLLVVLSSWGPCP